MSDLDFPPHLAHDCTQRNNNINQKKSFHIVDFLLDFVLSAVQNPSN